MVPSEYFIYLFLHLLLVVNYGSKSDKIADVNGQVESRLLQFYSEDVFVQRAKGTGQTTGHIATLSISNNSSESISVSPEVFYIPADRRYQSYYARIPETVTIPPNETVSLPLEGYCLDIHKPPVPAGVDMPPLSHWVPVESPMIKDPSISWYIIETAPSVPRYSKDYIEVAGESEAFIKKKTEERQPIQAVWPGTDIGIPYTINPEKSPGDIVPLLVEIVERIEETADYLQQEGEVRTPFKPFPEKEREAIVQQTIWVTMGALQGQSYVKEAFAERLYQQYESTTPKEIQSIPDEEYEALEAGVNEFWNSFMATGLEAKVLENVPDEPELIQARRDNDNCQCDTVRFSLNRMNEFGQYEEVARPETTTFRAVGSEELEDQTLSSDEFEEIELEVTDVSFICSCQDSLDCPPYNDRRMDEEHKDKFEVDFSLSRTAGTGSIEEEENEGDRATATIAPNLDFRNIYVYVRIKAYCMNEDCDRATCVRKFEIQFKQEDEEE